MMVDAEVDKVTRQQVQSAAAAAGVEIRRDGHCGRSMWMVRAPGAVWRNAYASNYMTLVRLDAMRPASAANSSESPDAALAPVGSAVERMR